MDASLEKRIKRQVIGRPRRFLAVVPLGFERTLLREFQSIGVHPDDDGQASPFRITGDGKVEFTAKITEAWKAVAYSRIANRVLMHLADFRAENFREFEKKAGEIPWELYLDERTGAALLTDEGNASAPPEQKQSPVHIHVTCKHSRLYHSDAVAERLRKVIEGAFSRGGSLPLAPASPSPRTGAESDGPRGKSFATPSAGTPRNAPPKGIPATGAERIQGKAGISRPADFYGQHPYEQHLYVHFLDDRCTVWLDLAGEELYRRGHERFVNDAPLKETIAAAMIFEACHAAAHSRTSKDDDRPHDPQPVTLFDLMAGSGTFSLEAAYAAHGLIPGVCRDFALKHQPAFKEATWNYMTNARSGNPGLKKIITGDLSERAVEIIRHNVDNSPLAGTAPKPIEPRLRDFFSYTAAEIADACEGDAPPVIVLNPPYGKRLDFDAPKLYTRIGRRLAELSRELEALGKALTVAILAPKDDSREGSKFTCTANLLRECPALSPENNAAANLIVTSHGGLTLNVFIANI